MRYLLNIFDLDGTLLDSREAIFKSINDTLIYFGKDPHDYEISEKFIGLESLNSTLQKFGIQDNEEKILQIYRQYYFEYISKYQKLFNGIRDLLNSLKNKLLLAIATNKGQKGTLLSLQAAEIENYFDCIITEQDVKNIKPHRESFDKIIAYYKHEGKNLDPGDVLMIGDSPVDGDFAANCGIDFAFCSWGFFDEKDLSQKPEYILNNPSDIIEINGLNQIVNVELTEELDLHTFSPEEIRPLVTDYLKFAREKGYTSIRIIHGKGRGVQREIVRSILSKSRGIKDFYDAPPYLGGRGATIVEIG